MLNDEEKKIAMRTMLLLLVWLVITILAHVFAALTGVHLHPAALDGILFAISVVYYEGWLDGSWLETADETDETDEDDKDKKKE